MITVGYSDNKELPIAICYGAYTSCMDKSAAIAIAKALLAVAESITYDDKYKTLDESND